MKLIKNFILSIAAISILSMSLLSLNVYAGAEAVEYVSAAKTNLTVSDNTYSNMYVNVIKEVNERKTTIYSGALGGYAGGAYSNLDFSKIDFMSVCDWNTMDSEAIYIVPVSSDLPLSDITSESLSADSRASENTAELQNTFTSVSVKTNMALMYDNKYYENVLLPGKTLNIPVTIENTGSTAADIIPYIAKYDLTGRITDLKRCDQISVPANQTVSSTLVREFNNDTACTAKVFLWQKNTMLPVTRGLSVTVQNQDYYADTFEEASEYDFSKQLCGVINTGEDVDIVKFTAPETGIYALQLEASASSICGLYDSSCSLLSSVSADRDKNYLFYSLNANESYYVRLNGGIGTQYELTPAMPSETVILTQNLGAEGSLASGNIFDVYKFTPQTTGSYIITAVDSTNTAAELYNSSFERISSSSVGDAAVSFRITSSMTAEQPYYIVVYPKNTDTAVGSYTVYVEEPLALMSVN